MSVLPRVRPGLLRHALDDQVLVYDSRDDRVHLLDPTTGCVFELLEEGGWTSEGITIELSERLGITAGEDFLPLALDELRKAQLLEPDVAPAPLIDVTRRELMRKLAMTGAAAILIPTIATLSASPGYAQGSLPMSTTCGPCTEDEQCPEFAGDPTKGCNEYNICAQAGQAPPGAPCGLPGSAPNCCRGSCSANVCVG